MESGGKDFSFVILDFSFDIVNKVAAASDVK